MKKLLLAGIIAFNTFFASSILAQEVQCPTAEQLKSEWSATDMRGVEKSEREVIFYQSPHKYGTNTIWYVHIAVTESDVNRALDKASNAVKTSYFLGGGMTPFGFYSCGYKSRTGEMIYASANANQDN